MQTIRSDGGPLLCVTRQAAKSWQGTFGQSPDDGKGQSSQTDYEKACEIADYIGKVICGNEEALVLGDMPLETMVGHTADQAPFILRVYYMDPGTDPVTLLKASNKINNASTLEAMDINMAGGDYLIFDSAMPGSLVGESFIQFNLPPGKYRVLTKRIEPNDRTSVLVHQFASIEGRER